jgi:ribosome-associated toxin RatA of RatAB toxin-antitoxin module
MIRKFGRVHATPATVRSIFLDVEGWPSWLPGTESVKVLERTDTTMVVELDGHHMGNRLNGVFDCRISDDSFVQNQRTGRLKRWDTTWRFISPPDGHGTTLGCEIEIDAGLIGSLVPDRFFRRFVHRVFAQTVVNLNAIASELARSSRLEPATNGEAETLLEIFETPIGYEILVGGKRIKLADED